MCLAEVTTNNSPREERVATKAREVENIKEKKKRTLCVRMLVEMDSGDEHFVQQSKEIIPQLVKVAAVH